MNPKIIMVVTVAILITVGIFSGPVLLELLGGGEYHTGFSMDDVNDCETVHNKVGCWDFVGVRGCWHGNIIEGYEELIFSPHSNAPIVTAMKGGEGERSIEVVAHGNLVYDAMFGYWIPAYGWYEVDIKYSGTGAWKTIINTKENQIDEDIVAFVSGARNKQSYYDRAGSVTIPGFIIGDIKTLNPIGFCFKGSQVGIMRVRQMTEFTALFGTLHDTRTSSIDYAFLVSGKGTVEKVDDQDRYVAGEDTVRFRVNTGYSGYTIGGEYVTRGWELKVYNNRGNLIHIWDIDDDKQGTRYDKTGSLLNYAIPVDAVEPGASHTWRVVLTNTLFDQSHTQFFAVTRAELEQAPDIKPIEFGEVEYRLGDTVTIYLEGIPNPSGRNKIDGFLVNIMYGESGWTVDYVEEYHLKYISATGNKATISFRASKGDTYVNVEAWAFDSPEVTGGIMSEGETAQVWIKDKESAPIVDFLPLIVAIAVFIIMLIIACIPQIPIPFGVYGRMVVVILGVVLAALIYWYLGGTI